MNCDEVRTLIDAYTDNELDLVTSLSIERHLQTCADCPAIYQNRVVMRNALKADALYFRPSPAVSRRLLQSLPQAEQRGVPRQWRMIGALGLGLLIVGLFLVTGLVVMRNNALPAEDQLVTSVLASHIRSLMADHLTDVISSDQHTVKPWFDGKIDYAPAVIDLAAQGFPLVGGRLDYLESNPVAALVYRNDKHLINLFIWPTSDLPDTAPGQLTRLGYHLLHWQMDNATYWAVSDLEEDKLNTFAELIKHSLH